jgi:hypothetical protein
MRTCCASLFLVAAGLFATGCGGGKSFDGPTVDKFNGKLAHDGKSVAFPAGETVQLKMVFQQKPESFGIPIKEDGTFQIGWMPIGKYSATLIRQKNEGGKKAAPIMYNVPDGVTIAEGQTEYTIELGKNWKP